jgi:hypothetical protein
MMDRKLRDLSQDELSRLPQISNMPALGEIFVHLYCRNRKKYNFYIAEYNPGFKSVFCFFENRNDGIGCKVLSLDELLSYDKKGDAWELMVDEGWKPVKAREVPILQGYISMVMSPPDY